MPFQFVFPPKKFSSLKKFLGTGPLKKVLTGVFCMSILVFWVVTICELVGR
jgi:hypothetical protein